LNQTAFLARIGAVPEKSAIDSAKLAVFLLLLCGAVGCGAGDSNILEFPQVDGKVAKPFAATNVAAVVVIFVSTECPISNRYSPEVQRLQGKFSKTGFWLVYPNRGESDQAVAKHLKEFGHTAPALRDPQHKLVRLARARVTPEAAVFSASGELLYHGRIDDRNVDFGKERPEPTTRDLEAALSAVMKGETPGRAAAPAVGCPIR
jgi:hypothetical protein